jgi:hypothetical protein
LPRDPHRGPNGHRAPVIAPSGSRARARRNASYRLQPQSPLYALRQTQRRQHSAACNVIIVPWHSLGNMPRAMHHRPWHVARNGYLGTCWATGSIARGMQHAPQRAATQSCDVAVCPVPRGNGESAQLAAAMQCGFPGALDVEDDNPETHTRFQRNQAASMPWDRDCTLGRRCALGLRTTVCGGGPIALCSYCAVVVQSARTFVMRPFLPFPFTPPQIHSLLRTHASIHASRLQAYSTIVGSLAGCIVGGAPRRTVRCAALRCAGD